MRACPSNMTVYDPLILGILARRPRDWDLFAAYARWKLAEYMRQTVRPRQLARHFAGRLRNVVRRG